MVISSNTNSYIIKYLRRELYTGLGLVSLNGDTTESVVPFEIQPVLKQKKKGQEKLSRITGLTYHSPFMKTESRKIRIKEY